MEYGIDSYNSYSTLLALLGTYSLVLFLICILIIVELWLIYKKCGKNGIASIIPIYNIWTYLVIGGLPGWLCLIPVANIVGYLYATFKIPKKFGKSSAFGLGILFLPIIFLGILAFSKNKVVKKQNKVVTNNNSNINQSKDVKTVKKPEEKTDVPKKEVNPKPVLIPNEIETLKEEPVIQKLADEPVENIVTGEMYKPTNTEPIYPMIAEFAKTEDPLVETLDNLDITPSIAPNNTPKTETLMETLEMPKIINEVINSDITVTKTCPKCGYKNNYVNKSCEKCGTILE